MLLTFYIFLAYVCFFMSICNLAFVILMFYSKLYFCAIIFSVFCVYYGLLFDYITNMSTCHSIVTVNGENVFTYQYHHNIICYAESRKQIDYISILITITTYIYSIFFDQIIIFTSKESKFLYVINITLYGFLCFWTIYDMIAHNIFKCANIIVEKIDYYEI